MNNVECLERTDAACAGGTNQSIGETLIAEAIALARSTPFGIGPAKFRHSREEGYVDTVPFAAYKKEVFDHIGLFDEELRLNSDDELNYRLNRYGGKVFFSPSIKAYYYNRTSFVGLFKQMIRHGYWKVRVAQKHHRPTTLRQLAPPTFVGALGLSSLIRLLYPPLGVKLRASLVGSYSGLSLLFAMKSAIANGR